MTTTAAANENKATNLSETTRNVFFPNTKTPSPSNSLIIENIKPPPSGFFLSTVLVAAKGLYPPQVKQLPKRSLSVPIKLITLPPKEEEHMPPRLAEKENIATTSPITPLPTPTPIATTPTPIATTPNNNITMTKSKSTPTPATIPTPTKSTSISRLKKPTLIDKLITSIKPSNSTSSKKTTTTVTSTSTTIRKAPRPSTSTRTASAAPIQLKSSTSIKLIHKKTKKKTPSPPPTPTVSDQAQEEEEEEDIPITKPITLTEKRKRQAKRADQVKIWKVREEREARELRSIARKKLMSGIISKKSTVESTGGMIRKKKKRVKFELDKNCIIQLENGHYSDDASNTSSTTA
jgi:hypothetical protein